MKTYFTFLERNKLFTFVNVAGLSISLMFVLLIANMVTRQLTVDKDLPDADRISVFANEHWAGGHYNLGDRLQSRYPEIPLPYRREAAKPVSGSRRLVFLYARIHSIYFNRRETCQYQTADHPQKLLRVLQLQADRRQSRTSLAKQYQHCAHPLVCQYAIRRTTRLG